MSKEDIEATKSVTATVEEPVEYDVAEALKDPSKKRKAEDEIEIDLKQSVPLSKKQKRLLRRGKVSLKEINEKFNIDPVSIKEYEKELKEKKETEEKEASESSTSTTKEDGEPTGDKPTKRDSADKFGVWVGNLSFDTTRDDLQKLLVVKIEDLNQSDIIRINLPLQKNDGKQIKNKGFAYIDLKTEELQKKVIALSESQLNGRNLLIKNSKSFTGRPDKEDLVAASKNPPSRILFVGNLSYEITSELLEAHFQHCGEIARVRMATFEDSGKCKGFAFIDFKTEQGATAALTDKAVRKIATRPIRMEYGEDRSKRHVRKRPETGDRRQDNEGGFRNHEDRPAPRERREFKSNDGPANTSSNTNTNTKREDSFKRDSKPRNSYNTKDKNNRVKSSIALASAQRASAAIVPSSGKKVKFD